MIPTPFTSIQAEHLRRFLAAPERPAGTLRYPELAGFLFAVCCAPEMVPLSDKARVRPPIAWACSLASG
jgi:hypothetical protein